ncbi:hypothetical protein HOP50_06g44930 [Chloropicon primus]|uniref:Uncharacterized protein n=1 Tax=Chloropicon primus TaxID=1764295 RepID=A0A5B8MRQ3_9CHLO|nr:hypothetical protein A3770_06p44700 [Chloropicon primus]UPR01172.1 hypothetical protein HOP50_06g44930 [Chloropicon primus]|eukprot:QDZ21952.1 hypothetical protein A3770_06p44700 [Chloropicon primus]
MNVVTIDGTQEVEVKRENEDFYKSRKKKVEEAAAASTSDRAGPGIVKDAPSGISVDLTGFRPVNRLRDNIESMYAVEVLKGEGMGQTTLKQTHVYISVQPEVQADNNGTSTKARVVRSFTPGHGGQPHAIKNTRAIFDDIEQTLEFVDHTNKETFDRSLEREEYLDSKGTDVERRRIVGESTLKQMEFFAERCKHLGLQRTPAQIMARMILSEGIQF